MSGDNNGRWAGDYNWPLDHSSYLSQATDMVLMIRSHPSLLFWCGGNELWPSNLNPPLEIQAGLENIVAQLDGRFLIMSSMDGGYDGLNMTLHDESYGLSVKDGPYGFLDPKTYFAETNPGMTNGSTVSVSFQPEVGSSGMPRWDTVKRMGLGGGEGDEYPSEFDGNVPELWDFHKFQGYSFEQIGKGGKIKIDPVYSYGPPANAEEYVVRANLACHVQYQSLFEGFSSKMFGGEDEGGKSAVIMWKSQR